MILGNNGKSFLIFTTQSLHYFDDTKEIRECKLKTWYIPGCPLRSHYQVCIKNHLFIVVIGPITNKELEFIFWYDCSNRTWVYRYQYYMVNFRYKNVTQSALFFGYKNVTQSVRIFVCKNLTQSALIFITEM